MLVGPLGHSWPGIGWWLSLTAADQGAWISGLGAFAAAFAALHISDKERRRRNSEREEQAHICAHYITTEMQRMAEFVVQLRRALLAIDLTQQHKGYRDQIYAVKNSVAELRAAHARIDMKLLLMLPTDVAKGVALAVGSLPLCCDSAESVVSRMLQGDEFIMQSQALIWAPAEMLRPTAGGLAAYFIWHDGKYPESRDNVSRPTVAKLKEMFASVPMGSDNAI